jgi:hypothetical protein
MLLTQSFLTYMESTRYALFYRLRSHPLPMGLTYPDVKCLTLIHCSQQSVQRLLQPRIFPSLQRIRYLSGHPGDLLIHRRFPRVEWVFPDTFYSFYDNTVEAGRGRKDPFLVSNTIVNGGELDGKRVYDFVLPERGIVSGEWYRLQQQLYFKKKHAELFGVSYPISEEEMEDIPSRWGERAHLNPHFLYYSRRLEMDFMKTVLEDSLVEGQS